MSNVLSVCYGWPIVSIDPLEEHVHELNMYMCAKHLFSILFTRQNSYDSEMSHL